MWAQGEGSESSPNPPNNKGRRASQINRQKEGVNMNTTITINAKNHTIEMNKTFAKAAATFGTDEYKMLQDARRDYPSYRVVTIKQKGAAVKADFAKLSFDFMDKYVKDHAQTDDVKTEYCSLRGLDENWNKDENGIAADYQTIKDWFLNTFPKFEEFRADRLALLEKIKREKEARLAARKKAA